MNGPDHYEAAEALLKGLSEAQQGSRYRMIAQAQVHATLALAAATAINTLSGPQYHAWHQVANR